MAARPPTKMNNRPPTMKDVAELAGVSKMAVSVVVNGTKSTVCVSEPTRARILKALEELQYQPNAFARSLRMKHTGTIGIYHGSGFISTRDPYIREIFHGLTEGLAEHGQDLLVYSGISKHQRTSVVERVLSNKVDAAIVLPSPEDRELIDALMEGRVPCVILAEVISGLKCVTAADADGSRVLAEYLLSKGHRRILYRRSSTPFGFERLRFEVFKAAVEQAGGEVVARQAVEPMDSITDTEEALLCDGQSENRITAIACWRDYSAVRALNFCLMHGIDVPGDISIAGFDGVQHVDVPTGMSLTTVNAHWRTVAHTATDQISAMLRGEAAGADVTTIPAELHVGTTA